MYYYKEVGKRGEGELHELKLLLTVAEWKTVKGEDVLFHTWHPELDQLPVWLEKLWPRDQWYNAFFLNIPPGGHLHRHADTKKHFNTYHIPLSTNDQAESWMYDPDPILFHLEKGLIYAVNRDVEHESMNRGDSERIHLLMEIDDGIKH